MINPLGPTTSVPLQPAKAGGVAQAAPARPVAAPEAAAASVSARPAATMAKAGPPVDTAKVDRVKAGLANGSYKVDAKAIAHAMVEQDLAERA